MALMVQARAHSLTLAAVLAREDVRWLLSVDSVAASGQAVQPVFDCDALDSPVVWLGSCIYPLSGEVALDTEPLLIAMNEVPLEAREDRSLAWHLQHFSNACWTDHMGVLWSTADLLERSTLAQLGEPVLRRPSTTTDPGHRLVHQASGNTVLTLVGRHAPQDVAETNRDPDAVAFPSGYRRADVYDVPSWPEGYTGSP